MKLKSLIIGALCLPMISCTFSNKKLANREPAGNGDRPPQFVLLAFDGSYSLPFWEESREFAKDTGVKFTYFISGVYFVSEANRKSYKGPRHNAGRSDIGFGDDKADIQARLKQVAAAVSEGHEMASHANGHFDGTKWNFDEWSSEHAQLDKFMIGAWNRVGLKEPDWWMEYFSFHRIGFRAPVLGVPAWNQKQAHAQTWKSLKRFNFQYDTSHVSDPNYWPQKLDGIWNFPLARIRRHGTKYSTLSMDYNFYYSHSNGKKGSPKHFGYYEKEMYESYLKYFKNNYLGNRAPVHIGHHFSKWNGGAYWRAMKRFAREVCGLPEVYCGTYRELQNYVQAESGRLANFQKGNFDKMSLAEAERYLGPDIQRVSFGDEGPLDHTELNKFLEVLKNHSPEASE